MRKMIFILLIFILGISITEAQKVGANVNITLGFQLNANYSINNVVLNTTYNHERNFDNFLIGGGYLFYEGIIEFGLMGGICNESFSSSIYGKVNIPLNQRLDLNFLYVFYQNEPAKTNGMNIGNIYFYPAVNLGIAFVFNRRR